MTNDLAVPSTGPIRRRSICAISLHTERLHEGAVWSRMIGLLDWLAERDCRATLFVEPLRARVLHIDLAPKLDRIAQGGHEVGMHTHFYELAGDPGHTTGFRKPSLFTEDNVRRCLAEDHDYLVATGHTPRGFVAGGWAIVDTTFRWLARRGFTYDSSYRTFPLRYPNPQAASGCGRTQPDRIDGLLELPTTAPLTAALTNRLVPWRRSSPVTGPISYEHVYLHDFDLLDLRKGAALRALLFLLRNSEHLTMGELAGLVSPLLSRSPTGPTIAPTT